ncbi:MAG: hypothetical protein GJ680_03255 [Alteromonadaceae bacterium]|nr:hypothetical protein [Alteromonadaceae bacterium]
MKCYCCSGKSFNECCHPFLEGSNKAATPEQLMRSRFSAYCLENYEYVLNTYAPLNRKGLSVVELANSAKDTFWLGLQVLQSHNRDSDGIVEFIATYASGKSIYSMHERSSFATIHGTWYYTTGEMLEQTGKVKISRNDPCPCQSGKKFKQCCSRKL